MKMTILSSKERFKKPIGNIHFGKIILILLLILGQVLTVNSNKVEASEQLYYYDRYLITISDTYSLINSISGTFNNELRYRIEGEYYESSMVIDGSSPYKDEYGNPNELIVSNGLIYFKYSRGPFYPTMYVLKQDGTRVIKTEVQSHGGEYVEVIVYPYFTIYEGQHGGITPDTGSWNSPGWVQFSGTKRMYQMNMTRGRLLHKNIIGVTSEYPTNGRHTDGYWYIRTGPVNTNPTITTLISGGAVSSGNSYFSKVNLV